MPNSSFKFKQFTINHDKCAMKVGTDGVLLGAWTPLENTNSILDVGTGTGLIALQLAQRNTKAKITAIEVDSKAAEQAYENVCSSSWSDRIKVLCCDFLHYQPEEKFNLIVSNPPYFVEAMKCPDKQRCVARHTGELNYDSLFSQAAHLLCAEGAISIIIPSEVESLVIDVARSYNLHPTRRMQVFTKPNKPCRRVLLLFRFQNEECVEESLCIEINRHEYTPDYIALTKDFYLKM